MLSLQPRAATGYDAPVVGGTSPGLLLLRAGDTAWKGGRALTPDPETRAARPAAQGSNTSLKLDAAPLSSHHGPPTAMDNSRPSRPVSDCVNALLTNFLKTRMASRVPHAKAPHTHFSPDLGAGGRGRVEDSS